MTAELDPAKLLQRVLGDTLFTVGGRPFSAWALELPPTVGALMVLGTERPQVLSTPREGYVSEGAVRELYGLG